jgi:hypothetical protein
MDESNKLADSQIVVKTYKGREAKAMGPFKTDSAEMAAEGYFPTSQIWARGQWGSVAFILATLLIFLFGLGIFIPAYLLIVRPPVL